MTTPNGPVVRLRGDVRDNSRAFGLPVVTDDEFTHAPECYWCDGKGSNDTCPRSIRLREYVAGFRAAADGAEDGTR